MLKEILFLVVVFFANVIQCITGFAGTVLAMPFSIMLIGYETAKPILNILGIAASLFIVIKEYRHINKKELLKIIGFMAIGILFSFFLSDAFSGYESILYKFLGILIIIIALINAYNFYKKKETKEPNLFLSILILIFSGLIHGLFVCGGMLVVTYANTKLKDKNEFRSTLSAVWLILNSIIMIGDIRNGYLHSDTLILLAAALAVLILSLITGNLIYKKLSRESFLKLTYVLMIISGISLVLK